MSSLVVPDSLAAVLRVTGEDAFAYLQSQFSNDLRRPGCARPVTYGLWLTRKGRVAADSLVVRLAPEEFLLVSFHVPPDALATKVLENVIADDVESAPVACAGVTFAGKDAADTLRSLGLPVPPAGEWAAEGALVVVASRRGGGSFEVVSVDDAAFAEFLGRIRNMVTTSGAAALESLRLASGIPAVPADCGPGDLPQEAGLDADAVAFTKGCYLGQEVMARLQAQGRATRTLTRVVATEGTVFSTGQKLFAGADEAGEIRTQAFVGEASVAMAMLKNRVSEGVETFAVEMGGNPVVTRAPSI